MRDDQGTSAGTGDDATARPETLSARIYGIMALTTVLTFTTLVTGYQLLFPPHQMIA